jgi:hypothetical protein
MPCRLSPSAAQPFCSRFYLYVLAFDYSIVFQTLLPHAISAPAATAPGNDTWRFFSTPLRRVLSQAAARVAAQDAQKRR